MQLPQERIGSFIILRKSTPKVLRTWGFFKVF